MQLRDQPWLNRFRRLRGWRVGDVRVMVEAKDGTGHFFCVYECRSDDPRKTEALVEAELAVQGAQLVEIAQERPASVPMPRDTQIVALSDRIPFGAAEIPHARHDRVDPR